LKKAVKYLETVTNIYLPRTKLGDGFILTQEVITQWKHYYQSRVLSSKEQK